jgi:ABC-type polysaccharide/polyol phosphate transport system ATPase subunit
MSDVVIRARDVRKIYRLYRGPTHRFLDMFGLLGARKDVYTEHAALEGVSLDIRRGEKVAFIGRNGAGKSTLLKLITRVIEPTSGVLEVQGQVHALLQIGTGFHPDFTGRENVFAYLAQLGVTGAAARQKFDAIVEFAELEEYINQPVKTYSAGMAVRLMFSTATAITPELLVLDEVLGVGDAYFAQKSYERMRELTDRDGATLLLVTHDIYSAVKICERLIWIDRGRVLMDGDGPVVMKAYEDSIRQQEEARLRARKQNRSRERAPDSSQVIVEIQSLENRPLPAPVHIARIELVNGATRYPLPIGDGAFDETGLAHLQREGTAWGEVERVDGRSARVFLNYGSPFHKVAGVVAIPGGLDPQAVLEVDYRTAQPFAAVVRVFEGSRLRDLGTLAGIANEWQTWVAAVRQPIAAASAQGIAAGVHGTGAITVTEMQTVNAAGDESHVFEHGSGFELRLGFRINQPDLDEQAQVLIAFHRDGIQDVCRVINRDLRFDARTRATGEIRFALPRLPFGVGYYTITVMVARQGYYDESQTRYFSLNPGVYACHTRAIEIAVVGGGAVAAGTIFVADGHWSVA